MLCFISIDRGNTIRLRQMMLEKEIFAYHRKFPDFENAHGIRDFLEGLPALPAIAIIDSMAYSDFGESVCREIKKMYPEVKCIVLFDRRKFSFEKYKFYPSSDFEIDGSMNDEPILSLSTILSEIGYGTTRNYKHLRLGNDRHSALYLGYPLELSPAEYRILLYLCGCGDKTVSVDNILGSCFAESYRMVETNIRSHISDINRKAKALGGRRLILSVRGEGYRLNRYM
ncbi:MAG: winged helix-turn-helix transcriptional regulator [Clostridia bacterium]|nr:winged helix-turn-helix transcriptional regulator [Clostridia bacterium]